VWLLRVVLGVAVWLRGARHWGRLLDVIGVDGHHAGGGLVRRHFEVGEVRRCREGEGCRKQPVAQSLSAGRLPRVIKATKLQQRWKASPRSSERRGRRWVGRSSKGWGSRDGRPSRYYMAAECCWIPTLCGSKRKTGTLHCRSRTSNRRTLCHSKPSAAHYSLLQHLAQALRRRWL
jgi:hypothetical protein